MYAQNNNILSHLLDLVHYEACSAYRISSKIKQQYMGGLVSQIPDDINFTLSTLLQIFGYNDCVFKILFVAQIDAVGKAKYFYYVDGLMTTNGFYIKLVKPVIFQHLY